MKRRTFALPLANLLLLSLVTAAVPHASASPPECKGVIAYSQDIPVAGLEMGPDCGGPCESAFAVRVLSATVCLLHDAYIVI